MDHTIVLFTRADSRFNLRQYIDKAHSTELLSPEESDQSAQTGNQEPDMNSKGTSAVHKFLTNDVKEYIMGLDNLCQSQYQKKKTRDALVELIDVVQTANGGTPFSHVYFDKAQQKLVRRKDEEKQAREDFLEEELKLWNEALEKAEKESDRISDNFWKGVQRADLIEEQQKGYKHLRKKDYGGAAKDLSQKVLAELSTGEENQQLQDVAKSYFSSGDKIDKAIKTYAKLNHEILKDLAKEAKGICFPPEATVLEESKGEMKICDVTVGDKLLAATGDGTLTFQDVFVLSKCRI